MAEYITKYPKTISFLDVVCGSLKGIVNVDNHSNVEQLHVVVKKNANELLKIFLHEGFTKVKFEHKQPFQIGNGLSLKLKKPWEMHVRFVKLKKRAYRYTRRSRSFSRLLATSVLPKNPSDIRNRKHAKKI